MQGVIFKSTGSWYWVKNQDSNKIIQCRIRGKFRLSEIKSTNPLAVGDNVEYQIEKDNDGNETAVITKVIPRENYIIRKSNKLSSQFQIIASNIDLLLPVFTLHSPITSQGFLDRMLVTAEAYHIPVLIIFNKLDLYTNDDEALNEIIFLYQSIGYRTIKLSTLQNIGFDQLRNEIQDKTCLISGHSGTGKSSIINNLNPELSLKTGEISTKHFKGMHTTTFAEMHSINKNTYIIDTPGIRDFGVIDIEDSELSYNFPEFRSKSLNCKFKNCLHINEPECAVIQSVEKGEINFERYNSYLGILSKEDFFK